MKISKRAFSNLYYRLFPNRFWAPYSRRSRANGLQDLLVVLSFDSDTDEDATASQILFERLSRLEIPATFAVPGSQLINGAAQYKALHKQGARLMNHGGAAHTDFRDGRYWSTNFYNQQSLAEVEADIRLGHKIFTEIFSEEATGFRAPHFGHFQTAQQLQFIYGILDDLGSYRFSSTTTAQSALKHGPAHIMEKLIEFPIVGTYDWPTRIFDSWGHVLDKRIRRVSDLYGKRLWASISKCQQKGVPALLNYYADPSHVFENENYFLALKRAKEAGVNFVDYPYILNQLSRQPSTSA